MPSTRQENDDNVDDHGHVDRSRTVQQKDQHRHIGEGATANDQTQVRLIELVVFIQGHGQNPFHQAALLP